MKPRGNVTRSPKQGYQWPHKKDLCPPKIILKKEDNNSDAFSLHFSPPFIFPQTTDQNRVLNTGMMTAADDHHLTFIA